MDRGRANDFRAPPPGAEDGAVLGRLPAAYAAVLRQANGWLWLRGGLHVRGACRALPAHSLERVWTGELALHGLFPGVAPDDVPFAQDAFGDQFLLRREQVLRLHGETGEVEPLGMDWRAFFNRVRGEGARFLGVERFLATCDAEGDLFPGQLVSVVPPFVMKSETYSLRRISADERIRFLADLARQLATVPDGAEVHLEVKE